ncbi:MAG: hypothetical protein EBR88_06470 [Betaproteobacteria bacterium]|nr:hypothetical protein [Betaproteobacteria bacterium]
MEVTKNERGRMLDNTQVNHIELCAGYGGIGLGLSRVVRNLRTIAFCEIEAFAVANLVSKMEAGLLDPVPIWSNLKSFDFGKFHGLVDVISGGWPCQPFSAAGKRKGKDDPRHLWPWIADGIRLCRPVLCLFENVEGHISLGLPTVVSDLEEMGYEVSWGVFSASEVGAPHQRKRVFILAARDDWMSHAGRLGLEQLADPAYAGLEARRVHGVRTGSRQGKGPPARKGRKRKDVADRDGAGLEGQPGHVDGEQEPGRVGAEQDGPAAAGGLRAWPARPGQQQFWWEPPRVVGPVPTKLADFCSGHELQGGDAAQAGGEGSCQGGKGNDAVPYCRPGLRGGDQGHEQAPGDMAHAGGDGQHRVGEQEPRGVEGSRGGEPHGCGQRGPEGPRGEEHGQAQPPVGGDAYGGPGWLDHAELYLSCDNRTDELRLLGNGVVPATAETAFRALMEEMWARSLGGPSPRDL